RARRRPHRPQLRPRRGRDHAQLGLRRRCRRAAAVTIPGGQARKLGPKPGQGVARAAPPPGWAFTDPPGGLEMISPGEEAADVIVAFFSRAADLGLRLPGLAERIFPDGAVWAAWPPRSGGHTSDIPDTVVREYALPLGLVDVKVAAIDNDWSGLRLCWRQENRRP